MNYSKELKEPITAGLREEKIAEPRETVGQITQMLETLHYQTASIKNEIYHLCEMYDNKLSPMHEMLDEPMLEPGELHIVDKLHYLVRLTDWIGQTLTGVNIFTKETL